MISGIISLAILVPVLMLVFSSNLPLQKRGQIRIQVVDGYTSKPIKGAIVVIPELNEKYITGSDGKTAQISVDVMKDRQYEKILPQEWGRITILTYFEGYETYALFYAAVRENRLREGPVIFMFPEGSVEEGKPFTVIEAPQPDWVNKLIEKYRPD